MVNVLSMEKLGKFIRHEGRAIVCVDETGQSILVDEFL